jgi:hypothetical protein
MWVQSLSRGPHRREVPYLFAFLSCANETIRPSLRLLHFARPVLDIDVTTRIFSSPGYSISSSPVWPVMELKALDGIVFQHSKIDLGDTVIIRLCAKEAETWVDGKRLGEYRNKGMTEQDLADWESIAPSISWMTLEERNERLPKEEV